MYVGGHALVRAWLLAFLALGFEDTPGYVTACVWAGVALFETGGWIARRRAPIR